MNKIFTMPRARIVYFFRKRRNGANFSVEQIFYRLAEQLKDDFEVKTKVMPYVSSGIIKRFGNILYAKFNQEKLNHITGDINFVAIFLKKNKTISTILDLGILQRTSGIKRKVLLNVWFKWPVYRSKWVTVISESTKADLLKNVKCSPDKIKVIYVPISNEFKHVNKTFNQLCPTILQIGAAPNKNLIGLIKAVKDIDCQLLIIGKISSSNLKLLEDYKIKYQNKVGIPFNEVIEAYEKSDLLFFASTFEGFGMPILEAQAVGRPVITSNLLSMPEVGGDACLYVNPYEINEIKKAIQEIINKPELRDELVRKGSENVKRFDADYIAKQYKAIYKEVLSHS